jgi:hypothetical protein
MWVGKRNDDKKVEWRPETEDWLKYAIKERKK